MPGLDRLPSPFGNSTARAMYAAVVFVGALLGWVLIELFGVGNTSPVQGWQAKGPVTQARYPRITTAQIAYLDRDIRNLAAAEASYRQDAGTYTNDTTLLGEHGFALDASNPSHDELFVGIRRYEFCIVGSVNHIGRFSVYDSRRGGFQADLIDGELRDAEQMGCAMSVAKFAPVNS